MFITCIGSNARNLPCTTIKSEEDNMNMEKVPQLIEVHCAGKTNIIYERFQFQSGQQQTGETARQHITVLCAYAQM